MADIGASVLAKLKSKAKSSGISYQQCLQLFFQEEFLRRLSKSPYADNFVLKGGLFIYTLTNFESRATVDIDFLMRSLPNDLENVEKMIQAIIAVPTGNDFIQLEAKGIAPITLLRQYQGVSMQIIGRIKQVRVPFDVDIGVGDVIVPDSMKRTIQVQLIGFESPVVSTYSLESTIAEKFDAILQRFELTSRMKDFYDIYYLAHTFNFKGLILQRAIHESLDNRRTSFDKNSFARILELEKDEGMQVKWRYFLKNIRSQDLPFQPVMATIALFLQPVYDAIIHDSPLNQEWNSNKQKWERTNDG